MGVGKTLTASGVVNDGNSGANYTVSFVADTTGVITARAITVTAQTDTKGYDGTTIQRRSRLSPPGPSPAGSSGSWRPLTTRT